MHIPRLIVAGEESGCGKTTIVIGLMGAIAAAGLKVQGFKTGPDYIDPSYYRAVTGRPGRNLDLWMVSKEGVLELFAHSASTADVAMIEGVMGLFDGAYPDDKGSTAHLAKVLRAPVLLVLDAGRASSSLGAKALGFRTFDPDVEIHGVILNGIAGEAHERVVRRAVERAGLPVVGAVPMLPEIRLPERHLGLIPEQERSVSATHCGEITDRIRSHLDVPQVLQIARKAPPLPDVAPVLFTPTESNEGLRIGVARDEAFSFYYEDNLNLLHHWGFQIVEFSPLNDSLLPAADLLWVGGGFPEVFAEALSRNVAMREELLRFARRGGLLYGECGGFMYLGESLTTSDGQSFPMAGLLPVKTVMCERLQALKYKEVEVLQAGAFFQPGDRLRGHEFHYSRLMERVEPHMFRSVDSTDRVEEEGVVGGGASGSYIHLHLASNPLLLPSLTTRLRSRIERPKG